MLRSIDGFVGLSLLVDRTSGRCITTTAWQSEAAMHQSDAQTRPIRERVATNMGGRPEVEEWELAVLHRDHSSADGACVRVSWMQVDPAQVDRGVDVYRMVSLPAMEHLDGFCSASLLVNRDSGRAVSSVTYDSLDAMRRSREQAGALRMTGASEVQAKMLDVGEFDLAIASLRAPEMA
jgi:hypothetical protein